MRDERIELMKAARFIEGVREAELSHRVADYHEWMRHVRQAQADDAARRRRDSLELQKMAREEDGRMRQHLRNQMQSMANDRSRRLAKRQAEQGQLLQRQTHRTAPFDRRSTLRTMASWQLLNPFMVGDQPKGNLCRRHQRQV